MGLIPPDSPGTKVHTVVDGPVKIRRAQVVGLENIVLIHAFQRHTVPLGWLQKLPRRRFLRYLTKYIL